jgi:protoporphyrinogen oxidase
LAGTTDDGWVETAHAMLSPVLGLRQRPTLAWVARWTDALPLINDAHCTGVTAARVALRRAGWAELAGAAYDTPGLDGAIRSGRDAARRLTAR